MPKLPLVVAALAAVGCHREVSDSGPPPPSAPASTADLDALWALAPDGVTGGVVVSPRGVAMLEHAWQDVERFMTAVPELAPVLANMRATMQHEIGAPSLSLAAVGWTSDKGFAAFFDADDLRVLIVPVGDRDKFLAVAKGKKGGDVDTFGDDRMQCKIVRGLYACAKDAAWFAKLGTGHVRDQLAKAGARGDIEAAGTIEHTKFAVVGQLARGALVVRGAVTGVPRELKGLWGSSKPRAPDDAAGFALADLRPALHKEKAPPMPLVAGVTVRDLFDAIDGVITVSISADAKLAGHVTLRDARPVATVIEHCADLPPLASLGATASGGICHLPLPVKPFALDAHVENGGLQFALTGLSGGGQSTAMTAAGRELARGEWSLATWGRGAVLGSDFDWSAMIPPFANGFEARMFLGVGLRVLALLNEVGLGVQFDGDTARFFVAARTAWSNPDDVVAKLVAIDPQDILAGRARARAKAIADAAPSSPFAADFRSGAGGMLATTTPIGIVAAVAIPAFLEYMKRGKRTEAELNLDKIGKAAKRVYGETGSFPVGIAALLPAGGGGPGNNCCGGFGGVTGGHIGTTVNNKCTAMPAAFAADPIWKQLELSIDEPGPYQYKYVGYKDGRSFTAYAIGDVDCNGNSATWELHGSLDAAGNPHVELVKPPPGVY